MAKNFRRPISIVFGALVTTALGGCYDGDIYGSSYASAGSVCSDRYYDYDPYAYNDGYGYNCYDGSDYGSGFAQIGFGGGWYHDYYYPGYGMWMFDNYRNRYPLSGQHLNYWGGRRAWWKHHKDRPGSGHWNRPGRGDGDGRPGRPGGWHRGDHDGKGPHGTRPGRPGRPDREPGAGNPGRPDRPGGWNRWDRNDDDHPRGTRPGRPGTPPSTDNPGRPDWGAGRPGRPDREPGTRPSRQIRDVIAPRDRPAVQRPAPSAAPPRSERPAPAARRDPPPPRAVTPPPRPAPSPGGRVRVNNERPD